MLGNSIQEPFEQYMHPSTAGGDQRWMDLDKFAQSVFETQTQRVDSVLHASLDHQPTDQKVQHHVARHFELDRFGSSTAETLFHPLIYLQFSVRRFDLPIIIPPKLTAYHASIAVV